jgi:hypothetical protein
MYEIEAVEVKIKEEWYSHPELIQEDLKDNNYRKILMNPKDNEKMWKMVYEQLEKTFYEATKGQLQKSANTYMSAFSPDVDDMVSEGYFLLL